MNRLSSEIVSFMDSFFLYFPESLDIRRSLKTYPKTHLTHTWHSQPVEGFDLKTVVFNVEFPKKSMCHLDGCCVLCHFFFWDPISNSIPKTIPSPRKLQVRRKAPVEFLKLTSEKNRDFLFIIGTISGWRTIIIYPNDRMLCAMHITRRRWQYTVGGRNPAVTSWGWLVYPILYKVSYIPGGLNNKWLSFILDSILPYWISAPWKRSGCFLALVVAALVDSWYS